MESYYHAAIVFDETDLETLIFEGDEEINPDTIIYVDGVYEKEKKAKTDEEFTTYLAGILSETPIGTKEHGVLEFDLEYPSRLIYVRGESAMMKYRAASVYIGGRVVFYDWAAWDEYFETIRRRKRRFQLEFLSLEPVARFIRHI